MISAGHPPLILVSRRGVSQTLKLESDPLGMFGGAILQRADVRVSVGDRFFLYSDGLIESRPGAGRHEGLDRLVNACVRHHQVPLAGSLALIVRDVRSELSAKDDLLLLAAEVAR